MRKSVIALCLALACLIGEGAQAASLVELLARGFRVVLRSGDGATHLLTRRGHGLYLFRQDIESLWWLSEAELKALREAPRGRTLFFRGPVRRPWKELVGTPGSTGITPPSRHVQLPLPWKESVSLQPSSAAERMAQVEHVINPQIQAAVDRHMREAEAALVGLEAEFRALAPEARIERGVTALRIEVSEPEQLIEILERISRRKPAPSVGRSAFKDCSWNACLASDGLSVSGSCGPAGVEISTTGKFAVSLKGEGRSASITLGADGLTLRYANGSIAREVTIGPRL